MEPEEDIRRSGRTKKWIFEYKNCTLSFTYNNQNSQRQYIRIEYQRNDEIETVFINQIRDCREIYNVLRSLPQPPYNEETYRIHFDSLLRQNERQEINNVYIQLTSQSKLKIGSNNYQLSYPLLQRSFFQEQAQYNNNITQEMNELFISEFEETKAEDYQMIYEELFTDKNIKQSDEQMQAAEFQQAKIEAKKIDKPPGKSPSSSLKYMQIDSPLYAQQFLYQNSCTCLVNAYKFRFNQGEDNQPVFNQTEQIKNNIFLTAARKSIEENPNPAKILLRDLIKVVNQGGVRQFDDEWNDFCGNGLNVYKDERKKQHRTQEEDDYLKKQFYEDYSDPQIFLRLFVYLYSSNILYKELNNRLASSFQKHDFCYLCFGSNLVGLLIKAIRCLMGKKILEGLGQIQYLVRFIRHKPDLQVQKVYHWPAFSSTTKNVELQLSKKYGSFKFQILIIKQGESSFGLNRDDWFIIFDQDYLKAYIHDKNQREDGQVLIIPGFAFQVGEIRDQNTFLIVQKSDKYSLQQLTD